MSDNTTLHVFLLLGELHIEMIHAWVILCCNSHVDVSWDGNYLNVLDYMLNSPRVIIMIRTQYELLHHREATVYEVDISHTQYSYRTYPELRIADGYDGDSAVRATIRR